MARKTAKSIVAMLDEKTRKDFEKWFSDYEVAAYNGSYSPAASSVMETLNSIREAIGLEKLKPPRG
jgi:hypothetical protein